jgi:predicted alpha/beta hydrolase family esterase
MRRHASASGTLYSAVPLTLHSTPQSGVLAFTEVHMDTTQIVFIHGGGDDGYGADSKLADSLQKNLGNSFKVTFPRMPEPDRRATKVWPKTIHETVEKHQPTFMVGHSFGASNLLQYFVQYGTPRYVRGVFLLAPPFWGSDADWDYKEYALPSNFADKLSRKTPLFLYQCRDDEVVNVSHLDRYAKAMPWATVRKLAHGGHQMGNDLSAIAQDIVEVVAASSALSTRLHR